MNVILIDDEPLALDYFEYQLKSVTDFNVIGKFTDPFQGKRAIKELDVDLVFLDIEIPDLNGIELAEKIIEKKPNLPIVFVTAYDDYAIKAFELNAIDYVLKPVSTSRLLKTISRIKQKDIDSNLEYDNQHDELLLTLFHQVTLRINSNDRQNTIILKWRTKKIEQLFLYLVQNKGKEVSKSLLIELLWPELEQDRAYQQLYTAIYNIRKTLTQYNQYFNISSIREGYELTLENLNIDVVQFEMFINSAVPLSSKTINDYENILALYKGNYLEYYDYVWAEGERYRLQVKWVQTTLKVVNWYIEQNKYERALILLEEICEKLPIEEEAHFLIMKINDVIGDDEAVQRQFISLREILLNELQVEPREEIVDWYTMWKKRHSKLVNDYDITIIKNK